MRACYRYFIVALAAIPAAIVGLAADRPCLAQGVNSVRCGLCSSGVGIASLSLASSYPQHGSRPFVTLLVRFADSTSVTPHPVSHYESLIGSAAPGMDHFFREVSYGNLNLAGSIVKGWYNLPEPKSYYLAANECGIDIERLKLDATSVADADVHFPDFYGINIILNDDTGGPNCGFPFQELTLDGVTRTYGLTMIIRSDSNPATLAHEIGHALGLSHSSGPYSATYDSHWDVMSGGANCPGDPTFGCLPAGINAFGREQLGWIDHTSIFRPTPGESVTFDLERLSEPFSVLDYLMGAIPIGGSATHYYTVESRMRAGYDDLGGIPAEGVIIHEVDLNRSERPSRVVDTDNNGDPNDAGAVWTPGETFTDTANGLSVKINSRKATSFNLTVTVDEDWPDPLKVTNTLDSGPGSLRNAILYANQAPGSAIAFAIPQGDPGFDGSVWTIGPQYPLPPIQAAGTVIDGETQTAFGGNTNPAGPEIVLDGSLTSGWALGLEVAAPNCTIRDLVISGFATAGIGFAGAPAFHGSVTGCYIGTDATGQSAAPNGYAGVMIFGGATGNTIGGVEPNARNLISGNAVAGVYIGDAGTSAHLVTGNLIGTDASGSNAVPNGWGGVAIALGAHANRIGGPAAAERNVISGNGTAGVGISDEFTSNNMVVGNFIGVAEDGSSALPNGWAGVSLYYDASGNVVQRNVLSGNTTAGATCSDGAYDNTITGNLIGLDSAGQADLLNGFCGVGLWSGARDNTVGGTASADANFICANSWTGVSIGDSTTAGNRIIGNSIGQGPGGDAFGNGGPGIDIDEGASGNIIGGPGHGEGNLILYNGFEGVRVWHQESKGNTIRGNRITDNGFLGIELNGGTQIGWGVTLNDDLDADSGPNNLQNYPTGLASSYTGPRTLTISGSMSGQKNQTYFVDFYRSASADPSGHGEGQSYLGSATVTTGPSGQAAINTAFAVLPSLPFVLSATATSASGDTSEFSQGVAVSGLGGSVGINIASLRTKAATLARDFTRFRVSGFVTVSDSSNFSVTDSTGSIRVYSPGHGLQPENYVSVTGKVTEESSVLVMDASPFDIIKLF